MLVCISTNRHADKFNGIVIVGKTYDWVASAWGVQDPGVLLGHNNDMEYTSGNIEVDPTELLDKLLPAISFGTTGSSAGMLITDHVYQFTATSGNIETDPSELLDKRMTVMSYGTTGAGVDSLVDQHGTEYTLTSGNIEVDPTEILDKIAIAKCPYENLYVQPCGVMFDMADGEGNEYQLTSGNIEVDPTEILGKILVQADWFGAETSTSGVAVCSQTYDFQASGDVTTSHSLITENDVELQAGIDIPQSHVIGTELVADWNASFTGTTGVPKNMLFGTRDNNVTFRTIGMTGEPINNNVDKWILRFEAGGNQNLQVVRNEGYSYGSITRLTGSRDTRANRYGTYGLVGSLRMNALIDNNLGDKDFGIEFWIYNTGWATPPAFMLRSSGGWQITFAGSQSAYPGSGGGFYVERLVTYDGAGKMNGGRVAIGAGPSSGSSNHYAINRVGGVIYTHRNGVLVSSYNIGVGVSIEADPTAPSEIQLGSSTGYYDNVWIRIGAAIRPQANFGLGDI